VGEDGRVEIGFQSLDKSYFSSENFWMFLHLVLLSPLVPLFSESFYFLLRVLCLTVQLVLQPKPIFSVFKPHQTHVFTSLVICI
jgi:hypothetical protein